MKIQKIDFVKDENNKTVLTNKDNIDKLVRYVLPIIERNIGWGSGDFTIENFLKDPEKYQDKIDGTVWKNVHILLDNNEPLGLLEFSQTTISVKKERHAVVQQLLNGNNLDNFEGVTMKKLDTSLLASIRNFLESKPIYTAVGVVLKPPLQNKKSGYADMLYDIISDGIVFGMTSNPIILRKRKQKFNNTLFFPLFGDFPKTAEEWAICMYVYAYVITHDRKDRENLEFGALYSPYFVAGKGDEYLRIAQRMQKENKITKKDVKRIEYTLSRKKCASAIFSWN